MRRVLACALLLILFAAGPARGQAALTGLLERLFGGNVEIGEVSGDITSRPTLRDVAIRDEQGVWLRIDEIAFDWSPSSLFARQIQLNDVTATTVRVLRPPVPAADADEEPPEGAGPLALPELPVDLNLGRIAIERLELAEPVLGTAAAMTAEGRISLERAGAGAELDLTLSRLDAPGEARILANLQPAEDRLELEVSVSEPAGGLIARAFDLPGLPPVQLSLSGEGPLSDWRGELRAAAGDAELTAQATIARPEEGEEGYRFTLRGQGTGGGLLPENVAELAPGGLGFDLAGRFVPGEAFRFAEGSRIVTDLASAEFSGAVDLAARTLDLSVDLTAQAPAARLLEPFEWEALSARLAIAGGFDQPTVTGAVAVDGPEVAGFAADAARLQVSATPQSDRVLALRVEGDVDQARLADDPRLPPRDLTLLATGSADLAAGSASLDGLRLETGDALLSAEGDLGPDGTVAADLRVEAQDLSIYAPLADIPLAGSVVATARVEGRLDRPLTATLQAQATELQTGVSALDAALGDRAQIEGVVLLREDGGVTGEVAADGANARVAVEGVFADGRVDADFEAALPELSVFAPSLAGELALVGNVSGTPDDLTLTATAQADPLVVAGRTLPDAEAQIRVADLLDEPQARIALTASPEGVAVEVAADAALREGQIVLDDLRAAAGANVATGRATLDLETLAAQGALEADMPALHTLGALIGVDLPELEGPPLIAAAEFAYDGEILTLAPLRLSQGRNVATAEARLNPATGAVDGQATATLLEPSRLVAQLGFAAATGAPPATARTGFRLADGRFFLEDLRAEIGVNVASGDLEIVLDEGRPVGAVDVEAGDLRQVGELLDLPLDGRADARVAFDPQGRVEATVDATELVYGDLELAAARLTATGPLDALRFEAAATGEDLTFGVAGTLDVVGPPTRVALERLEGVIQGVPIALRQPASLAFGPNLIAVEDLLIDLESGRIAADLTVAARRIEGAARIEDLPLSLFAALGGPPLEGVVDASLDLGGTVADPAATARIEVSDVRGAAADVAGVFALDAVAEAVWRDGRVAIEARLISEEPGLGAVLTASLPLVLREGALAPVLPESGAVSGAAQGELDIGRLSDLLAARGGFIDGRASFDLTLDGTVAEPRFAGSIHLADGRYVNAEVGLALTGVQGAIEGEGASWIVRDLTAQTPEGGPVRVDGAALFDPLTQPSLRLTVAADNARLIERDAATIFGDLDLQISGRWPEILIEGDIDITEAEARLSESLPPQIVELDYIDANLPGGPRVAPAIREGPGAGPLVLRLDVTIAGERRVFIRGRGLDVELGGAIEIGGTAADPDIDGELRLIRGTFDILGNRIVFTRGSIALAPAPGGGFLTLLNLSAETEIGDTIIVIALTGPATEPVLAFNSDPELPQDEILSRLLFGKATGELSAFEAIGLAQSAAALAGFGGGGGGLFGAVRESLGLDRLEIVGDAAGGGGGGISAGRYLSDRVFVGVEQSFAGESEVNIEVEVTESITLETGGGPQSGARVGVFFEWEY